MSLGFSAAHVPLQQPPRDLIPPTELTIDDLDCTSLLDQRQLSNWALEVMDHEIGRLLIEAGIASPSADGGVSLKPNANTYVIVIGDNGTYGPTVKPPFNPERAKGTAYQGGVWVPLIIAGPGVINPGRNVEAMVNSADLYALFAEIANVDIQTNVPPSRIVDARSMMRYLRNGSGEVRDINFSMMGRNISAPGTVISPCVLEKLSICTQIFPQRQLCEDEGGTWYGPNGEAGAAGLADCCAVNAYREDNHLSTYTILPDEQQTDRNKKYKLVQLKGPDCVNGGVATTEELYRINQAKPEPKLDNAVSNLLDKPTLTRDETRNYEELKTAITRLRASETDCPGDGNKDGKVDQTDVRNYRYLRKQTSGNSSWYDFNHDGHTDQLDLNIINSHLGTCPL